MTEKIKIFEKHIKNMLSGYHEYLINGGKPDREREKEIEALLEILDYVKDKVGMNDDR